jgi:glycosyltransferase involved in cell wall biosynthesis
MKVSVVIPVYNAAPYIKGCIDALRRQTLDDFEAVFVDDHGSDNSIEIARNYVTELNDTQRFRFVATTTNSGPGVARNVGVLASRGDYVGFMDSDDEIDPIMFQAMVEAANKVNADICYCQLRYKGGKKDGHVFRNPILPDGDFSTDLKSAFLTRFTTFSVTFFYRRRFLVDNALAFPPERSSEDTNFLIKVLLAATRVAVVNSPMYYYCIRPESLTTHRDPQRYKAKLSAMEYMLSEVRTRGWYAKFSKELDFLYIKKGYLVAALNYLSNVDDPKVEVLQHMSERLDISVPNWRTNVYRRRSLKVAILSHVIYNSPQLAVKYLPRLLAVSKVAL